MRILLPILLFISFAAEAGRSVSFSGEITPDSLARLEQKILKQVSKFKTDEERLIIADIDSGGGNLYATLSFIERIQKAEVDLNFTLITRVTNACESSCTVLFTAGHIRQASRSAEFGFHSPAIASKLPKGVDRKEVLRIARERWLGAVARVDAPLSYDLEKRGLLNSDNMKYIRGRELATGYVSELIR